MGRPTKYRVDAAAILQAIYDLTIGRRAELQAEIDGLPNDRDSFSLRQQLHRELVAAEWAVYDASSLVGHHVEAGERRARHLPV